MMNFVENVNHKQSVIDLTKRGDFCFTDDGGVILSCPFCGVVFSCHHSIESKEPLTLSPSIVGPTTGFAWGGKAKELFDISDETARSQILTPCGHHFWIKNGKVLLTI